MLKYNVIFKNISHFIVPYIILYGLYIQVNGEISPGGGFQAGVIFSTCIVLIDIIHGKNKINDLFSINFLLIIAISGVLIYASVGVISLIFGDNYLNYYSITKDKYLAQTIGISIIEIGVGLSVSAVMSIIYILFRHG